MKFISFNDNKLKRIFGYCTIIMYFRTETEKLLGTPPHLELKVNYIFK